ncbi:MAG: helix-turn-helix domain-containing protein, partial [Alcaligenes sp.]
MIQRALLAADGNRTEAARRLGLSRQQLYRKLAEHGLE